MNARVVSRFAAIALAGLATAAYAVPPNDPGYNAFLKKIAAECKPLEIGNDNFSQAIVFNGQGASSEHYAEFLDKTNALYSGGLSAKEFHDSISWGAAGGKTSDKAIQCIIDHVPKK